MNRTYREQSKLPKEVWIYLFYCVVLNERIVGSWHSYLFSSWTLTSSLSLLVNIFLCKQLPSSTTFGFNSWLTTCVFFLSFFKVQSDNDSAATLLFGGELGHCWANKWVCGIFMNPYLYYLYQCRVCSWG